MTYDDLLPGPVDRSRIELVEDHELRFWTREFRCSAEQLLNAIESVGIDPTAVAAYLVMRRDVSATSVPAQMRNAANSNQRSASELRPPL
jgi:Protein of unknown function (DUF3606)